MVDELEIIGKVLWVNWAPRMDVAFMRLKKNTEFGRPAHDPVKSQLSEIYQAPDGELILRRIHKPTLSNPWGRDANECLSNDNYWLTEEDLEYLKQKK